MSSTASDNFARADENPLGGNWTAPDGVAGSKFSLASSVLQCPSGATVGWMYYNAVAWTGNHNSQVTLTGSNLPGFYGGVGVRIQSAGQSGYLFANIQGAYTLQRLDNSTRVTISTCSNTPTVGDILKCEISGSTILAYVNSSQVGSAIDATYSTGAPGLFGYGGSQAIVLDDWFGNDVGGGGGGGGGSTSARGVLSLLGVC